MKHLLVIISSWLFLAMKGQYTITATSAPVTGDFHATINTYSTGLSIPATGLNKLWNYTTIAVDTSVSTALTYTPASSAPNANLFPSATMAAYDGQGKYEMYGITSGTLGYLGSSAPTASDCSVFSNPMLYMNYPFAYGNAFNDNFAVSNSQYSMSGTLSVVADGTGTLMLPGITLTNVLKTTMSYTQNMMVGTSNIVVKSITHNFYSPASKFELFSVISRTTATGTSTVADLYGQANKQFVTGIKENTQADLFQLYPVPCNGEVLNVKFPRNYLSVRIMLCDLSGRTILEETSGEISPANILSLKLNSIRAGAYLLQINTGTEKRTQKILVQ